MPFTDLNKKQTLIDKNYDYTIIGAGAAGILMAVKLSNSGYKVAILETGHFEEDEQRQVLNEVVHQSKELDSAVWGRKRAIGGTTVAWGGQSLPFSSLDFEKRDWLQNSGWCIHYSDLAEFYNEANLFMKIDTLGYDDGILEKLHLLKDKPISTAFDYHVSKWAKNPNFFSLYKNELDKYVDVYYNAHVMHIETLNKKAEKVEFHNFKHQKFEMKIKNLIVTAGGLETVRLLLLNNLSFSPWLGKCFMEHPCIEFGEIRKFKPYQLQRLFNTHIYKGQKYSIRLSLSRTKQLSDQLLNASVSILFRYPNKSFNPYAEIKSLVKEFKFFRLPGLLSNLKYILPTLYSSLKDGFLFKPGTLPKLTLMLEQEAIKESKLDLAAELDSFGQQKLSVDWIISELCWKTCLETANSIKELFFKNKLGEAYIYPHLNEKVSDFAGFFSGVNHHMGGARMGTSPENSVVDKNLKLWEYENIFICSSAAFPTSSHSNPTLTLLALSCRLHKFILENEKDKRIN